MDEVVGNMTQILKRRGLWEEVRARSKGPGPLSYRTHLCSGQDFVPRLRFISLTDMYPRNGLRLRLDPLGFSERQWRS
jgi:hypothetical protein